MTDREKEFENLVNDIRFDDTPDYNHREKLEQDLLAALNKQNQHKPQALKIWRNIVKNRVTQFATAAAIIMAVLIGLHYLGGSIDGATIAWADVMEQIKSFRPYAYTQTTRYYHTDKTIVRRFMILNQYQRREEFPDGTVRIFDYSEEPTGMLQLNPKTKEAAWKMSSREAGPINNDILMDLRRFEGRPDIYPVEDRGIENMDGQRTKCFHIAAENFIYTAWVDIQTRLPVRVELEQSTAQRTLIMTDFDFNPSFDETQFDRIPPEGYTLSEYSSEEDQISEQSHVFRPRAYTYTSLRSDGSKTVCRMLEPTIDCCRREYDNGQIEIYDYSQQPAKCLKLDTEKKQAVLETYLGGNRNKINIELLRIIENAEAKPELYKVEDRGIQPMDGHINDCIYIPGMNDEILFTVWKDIDTGLPVCIEQIHSQTLTLILTDFEFDVAFDPNLFELKAPEGYTLTEVTYPAKTVEPDEAALIEGLCVFSPNLWEELFQKSWSGPVSSNKCAPISRIITWKFHLFS